MSIDLHPWAIMGVKRQVRTPREAVVAKPVVAKCSWGPHPATGTALTADRKPIRVPACDSHGKRGTHRPLPVDDDTNQIPLEVYSLIVHAQAALKEGDTYRADSALELALRRLER